MERKVSNIERFFLFRKIGTTVDIELLHLFGPDFIEVHVFCQSRRVTCMRKTPAMMPIKLDIAMERATLYLKGYYRGFKKQLVIDMDLYIIWMKY